MSDTTKASIKVMNEQKHLGRDDWHEGSMTSGVYSSHKAMTAQRAVAIAALYESGDHGFHLAIADVEFASRLKREAALADEVASVLARLDKWAVDHSCSESVFSRCRDRLRAAIQQAKGESR